jgi:mannose-1-phosphate guanylyltransferase/phosphomannomutase
MEHILGLLRLHGIHEVIVTVQYLSSQIEDYFGDGSDFGMSITYSVEPEPLGTAGSVRRCAADLQDTFLVISGDALTDIDLGAVCDMHRRTGAWVTLALARVPNPLEFGVVITDQDGTIQRFLEKPGWGEVFSDTINTGIYVVEPQALAEVPPGVAYDFSKELFPKLMAAGAPLYGCAPGGYWCDIGNVAQLMAANEDVLRSRVAVEVPGRRFPGDIWIGSGVTIDPGARITGPVVIGDNCVLQADAAVDGPAVIGPNSVLGRGCHVARSVLVGNGHVGPHAAVRGAMLGRGVRLGQGSVVEEGVVVGDGCHLHEGCQVRSEVKIWPNKVVEADAVVNQSIVWGNRGQRSLFGAGGVSGATNVDVTPEVAVRLGAAYASSLQRGDAVVVSRDDHPASVMMKRALMAGLASAGVRVYNLDCVPMPVMRYAAGALGARGGAYTRTLSAGSMQMEVRFVDSRGIDLDMNTERKIENLYFREDMRKVAPDDVGAISYPAKVLDIYITGYLGALGPLPPGAAAPRLVVDYAGGSGAQVVPQVLAEYGAQTVGLGIAPSRGHGDTGPEIGEIVRTLRADCGVRLDTSGERMTVLDDRGRVLSDQEALVLLAALAVRHGNAREIAVPITATEAVEEVCGGAACRVRRTRSGSRALMEAAAAGGLTLAGDGQGGFAFPAFHPAIDGMFAMGLLLRWLAREQRPLSEVAAELPRPAVQHEAVPCPWQAKGQLMRRLVEVTLGEQVTLLDGIKVHRGRAWVAVLPDAHRPVVHLHAEPAPGEGAALLLTYRRLIEQIVAEAEAATALEPEWRES